MDEDYEINIDLDLTERDAMTIFIKYKVCDYDEKYTGATGVGLTVSAVRTNIIASFIGLAGREILKYRVPVSTIL